MTEWSNRSVRMRSTLGASKRGRYLPRFALARRENAAADCRPASARIATSISRRFRLGSPGKCRSPW